MITPPRNITKNALIAADDKLRSPQRLLWVDAMRGFSIILVVFGHVLMNMGIGGEKTALSAVLMTFRMPLFFFVSGFFSFRVCTWWTKNRLKDILTRKFTAQILGTLIFFVLFRYLMTQNISFANGFQGYWFAIALFQMYMVFVAVSLLNRVFRTDKALICMMILAVGLAGLHFRLPSLYIAKLLAWSNFTHFFQFFTLGLICARFKDRFFQLLGSNKLITIVVIGFVITALFWPVKTLSEGCIPLY